MRFEFQPGRDFLVCIPAAIFASLLLIACSSDNNLNTAATPRAPKATAFPEAKEPTSTQSQSHAVVQTAAASRVAALPTPTIAPPGVSTSTPTLEFLPSTEIKQEPTASPLTIAPPPASQVPPAAECPAPVEGPVQETSAKTDREALEALYQLAGGRRWSNAKLWMTDRPIGEWYGVTTNSAGRVTELRLPDNELTGGLSQKLGNLSYLTVLDVRGNPMGAKIPSNLGNLSNLTSLSIGYDVSGTVPAWLCNLTQLNDLYLQGNLTGPIPTELANLRNLETLHIDFVNGFAGELPPELGNLSSLKHLLVTGNRAQLTGTIPPELGNLSNLEDLYLRGHLLKGVIPPELGNLSNLQSIELSDNRLTGEIPRELGNLSSLFYLDLSDNHLSGSIPSKLGNLSRLLFLLLSRNELTGPIPPELGNPPNLISLSLNGNKLNGAIPPELGNLALLNNRSFMDQWPEEPPDSSERDESLFNRYLQTGEMSLDLAQRFMFFSSVDLSDNNLSGEIPAELGNLVNLSSSLDLASNNLSGSVPVALGNLVNLGWLMLAGNNLTGELPQSVLSLPNLHSLSFGDNAGLCAVAKIWEDLPGGASGPICHIERVGPEVAFHPADLEVLEAVYHATGGPAWTENRNWLTDLPPSEWAGVVINEQGRVTELYLTWNNLTGTIPPDLGKLTALEALHMSGNQLTGQIPIELANLSKLASLDLSFNRLEGELPQSFGQLTGLERLNLEGNNICLPLGLFERSEQFRYWYCEEPVVPLHAGDREVLVAFYHATDGPNWDNNDGWLGPDPDWHGVEFDEGGRVIILSLDDNSLSGSLPPELGNLSHLIALSLDDNDLTGSIPPELEKLTHLFNLSLENNDLTGLIPPELGNLSELTHLRLTDNNLTGPIPLELGNLSNLAYMELYGNKLEGAIPLEMTGLSNLDYLTLPFSNPTFCVSPGLENWFQSIERALGPACQAEPLTPGAAADWKTLAALFNSARGPEWYYPLDWFTAKPIGKWSGVQTDDEGRVESLHLYDAISFGRIPPELGNLSNLVYLNLGTDPSRNVTSEHLHGTIPPELGNLTNLKTLILNNNSLTGTLPQELGNLSKLIRLDVSHNRLHGEIPEELTKLPRLREIDFRSNIGLCYSPSLQGWLDSIEGLGPVCRMPTAETEADRAALLAFYNAAGGPDWIRNDNWLTDIPVQGWYGVTIDDDGRVVELKLCRNGLTGFIAPELGDLSELTDLDLCNDQRRDWNYWHNGLTGTVPPELGNLSNLERLALDGNFLEGEVPGVLFSLEKLEVLDIRNNSGLCVPPTFKERFQRFIGWWGGGPICAPPSEADRAALTAFYHATGGPDWVNSRNWLTDAPLWGWQGVQTNEEGRVIGLYLPDNNLRSVGSSDPGATTSLDRLDPIGEISAEPSVITDLGNLTHLALLNISDNKLTGSIPPELASLLHLGSLDLSGNNLSGGIPPELGNLPNLSSLNLSGNHLAGNIPPDLGNLSSLYVLHLSGNSLTGNVPPELGKLLSLNQLSIGSNRLEGEIPNSFSALENLRYFGFGRNSGLCAPESLRGWLEQIDYRTDPECPIQKKEEKDERE